MDINTELRQLKSFLKLQETKKPPMIFRAIFIPIIWLLFGVTFVVLKNVYGSNYISPYVYIAIVAFVGILIALYSVHMQSYKSWPVIKPYVDLVKIKERVKELEET